MADTTPALRIEQLCHAYDQREVLRLDALALQPAEQVAVLGPSGCGKTTLLHVIAGLLTPTRGDVRICGQSLGALSIGQRDRFRGRHLGIVFQRLHLLPALSVLDNLLLAQRLARTTVDASAARQLLDRLEIADLASAKPTRLSVGQAQRVAIARALVHRPSLLLADEPTSSLDDSNAARALSLLRTHAQEAGAGLLIVTHDQRISGQLDRELVLKALS